MANLCLVRWGQLLLRRARKASSRLGKPWEKGVQQGLQARTGQFCHMDERQRQACCLSQNPFNSLGSYYLSPAFQDCVRRKLIQHDRVTFHPSDCVRCMERAPRQNWKGLAPPFGLPTSSAVEKLGYRCRPLQVQICPGITSALYALQGFGRGQHAALQMHVWSGSTAKRQLKLHSGHPGTNSPKDSLAVEKC